MNLSIPSANLELLRIIEQREETIDLLREQNRALNAELIKVKNKLKNLEEKND